MTPAATIATKTLEDLGLLITPEFRAALELAGFEVVITGGYRAGKSKVGSAKIFVYPKFPDGILVWIVGPTYLSTNQEMIYLHEWCDKWNLVRSFSQPTNEVWRLELKCGTVVETRSAQHTERLASVAPDFILVTEAGQCPPTVRAALLGRALERGAPIIYTGTLEADDEKPQYAWFEQLASDWRLNPTYAQKSVSLPSWSNLAIFNGIDPITGKTYIHPETGEPSSIGRQDWRIKLAEAANDAYTFARKYAGIPLGAPNPVYHQLVEAGAEEKFIKPIPANIHWETSVGGADWGVVHPWALVVVSASTHLIRTAENLSGIKRNVAWVRECVWSGPNSGDSQLFNQQKRLLSAKYRASRWGVDPVQSSLADNFGTRTVKGSAGSRDGRIGMVRSRLNNGSLYFDPSGPGVQELFAEMKLIRYKVGLDGKQGLLRDKDDRSAALEDAVEVLDTAANLPGKAGMKQPSARVGVQSWQPI